MNAHKIEIVLTEDGTLTLRDLPFHVGDTVEVIILHSGIVRHPKSHKFPSDPNPYPLHNTKPYLYNDPTEPVALEDWEVLQ